MREIRTPEEARAYLNEPVDVRFCGYRHGRPTYRYAGPSLGALERIARLAEAVAQ